MIRGLVLGVTVTGALVVAVSVALIGRAVADALDLITDTEEDTP